MTKIEIKWELQIEELPDCIDHEQLAKAYGTAIAKTFMLPEDLLTSSKPQSVWRHREIQPELPPLPDILSFNCRCHFPDTPYTKFYKAFMQQLKEEGYHEDVIERIDFVLKEIEGIAFIHNLTSRQMNDQEFIVQGLLELYKRLTG